MKSTLVFLVIWLLIVSLKLLALEQNLVRAVATTSKLSSATLDAVDDLYKRTSL